MSDFTRGQRLEIVEEQVRDLTEQVNFIGQFIDLTRFNRVQAGGMRGIPPEAIVELEREREKLRAEYDPIHQIVRRFELCKTPDETKALMKEYNAAVEENDERIRKLTEEMNAYLAGGDEGID